MKAIATGPGYDQPSHQLDWGQQRDNIASVVHDEICPILNFLLHDIYWIEKNTENNAIKTRANHCIDELTKAMSKCRNVLLNLQSHGEGPSLYECLEYTIDNFKKNSEISVSSEIDPDINQLEVHQQLVIFRSIQEALSNVKKHSHAKHVSVKAKIMLGHVHVVVLDDGIGMEQAHATPSFCLGLKFQKQQSKELGGHFSVQKNSNGKGTKIHLTFPLYPIDSL
jgi:two-component system nitrate/nitrite sensor histidine kinase NarX